MKKTKSFVVTLVIIIYLLGLVPRQAVYAQEAPPVSEQGQTEGSTTPDPSPSPDPSPLPSSDPSVLSSSEPSASQSPDPCAPPECPSAEVTQENDTGIDNDITATTDTGGNTVSPSPDPTLLESVESTASASPDQTSQAQETTSTEIPISSPAPDAQIQTGDATTEVNVVNVAGTNTVNSNYIYHIENIYFTTQEQIDLTNPDLPEVAPSGSLIVIQKNDATIDNSITAIANSGQNLIDGALGEITTGNSTVVVNIFNFINTNMINSSWQIVVINIFGDLAGNIILPEETSIPQMSLSGVDISQSNNADIQNSVNASSSTGENNLTGAGSIDTGNAQSVVNAATYANYNFIGTIYNHLVINNFGIWNGKFLGWGTIGPVNPTYGQMIFSFSDIGQNGMVGGFLSADTTNNAVLNNQVTANANSGQNAINGQGQITTGNAYSAVSIFNFVNTNIIQSTGFFGIINIFGSFTGNIGGESYFAATQNAPLTQEPQVQTGDQKEVRVAGGQLETEMSTNVGTHVNPGDTVMFFITVKNPGTGPFYDSKVTYNLYDANGEIAAIQTFDLGKLNPGERAYISFGIVLAKTAPAGYYQALVQADGKIGPDDQEISSQSSTGFAVGQGSIISSLVPEVYAAETISTQAPDSNLQGAGITFTDDWGIYLLFIFFSYIYMLHRIFKPTKLIENLEKEENPISPT